MKNLIYIFLFLFCFQASAQIRYANVTAQGTGDGTSEANAWSLTTAAASATAGMTVHVKAGNYASANIVMSNSGTAENPIRFIGYTTAPGDIVATTWSTYDEDDWLADGQNLPDNVMPHLEANPVGQDPTSSDLGIQISGDYVEVHNFMLSEYYGAIRQTGNYQVLNNIVGFQFGMWNPASNCWEKGDAFSCDNRTGYGIYSPLYSDLTGNKITNCTIIDAGLAAYFPVSQDNILIENCRGISYNRGNGSDYLFDLLATTNSTLRNNYAERTYALTGTLGHASRSLILQGASDGNVVETFESVNVRVQIENSRNNVLRDFTCTTVHRGINDNGLQIYGQSDNNLMINWEIQSGNGVQLLGNLSAEFQRTPYTSSGENNFFINFKIYDIDALAGNAAISAHRFLQDDGIVRKGTFINLTVDDVPYVINANEDLDIKVYNSTFSNINNGWDTFYAGWGDDRATYSADFFNCNFENATNAFGDPTDDLNAFSSITSGINVDPLFTNDAIGDFTLQASSNLIDVGMDGSTINANADFDYVGNARGYNGTDDIGAYEYTVVGTVDVTGVSLSPTTAEILVAGTQQYTATVLPTNATDKTGVWSSSNTGVATVNSSGLVTGVATGTTNINFVTTDGSFGDPKVLDVVGSLSSDAIGVVGPYAYLNPSSIDPSVTTTGNAIAVWEDLSGLGNDGTPVGTINLKLDGSDRMVEYKNGNSYFTLPDHSSLDPTPGTDGFSLIAREGNVSSTAGGYFISKSDGTNTQYGITYVSGNPYGIVIGGSASFFSNVPTGTNRLIVVNVSTTAANVWINGVQVVTNGPVGTATTSAQANLGGRSNGSYLVTDGATMDIAAIGPELTTPQITAIHNEFIFNASGLTDVIRPKGYLKIGASKLSAYYFGSTKVRF